MAITATTSATPSLQATLSKARLEQAKREAENAETKVEALQQQTERAEQEVQAKRENVRELSTRTALEDTTYMGQLRAARSAVAPATQDFCGTYVCGYLCEVCRQRECTQVQPRWAAICQHPGRAHRSHRQSEHLTVY